MLKTLLVALGSVLLISNSADTSVTRNQPERQEGQTGTLEKMIVANGSVVMNLDLGRLNSGKTQSRRSKLSFTVTPDSFFTILVFNGELRGLETGSMPLVPQNSVNLPAALNASLNQLVIQRTDWGGPFELVVRDGKSGFSFFDIEGSVYDYDAKTQLLNIKDGRLLLSKEFAAKLGRPRSGGFSSRRPLDYHQYASDRNHAGGERRTHVLCDATDGAISGYGARARRHRWRSLRVGAIWRSSGTQVGLAVGTDSCNAGVVPLNWLALPQNDTR